MVHDAGRVGRHEEGSFEGEIQPEVKRNFFVRRIDENADDSEGQRVLGMELFGI